MSIIMNKVSFKDERFPVWQSLCELFLDTELIEFHYESISTTLANSDYSLKELEAILYYEVYPVCKDNLLSVAGEWVGFGDDWIMEYIAPRKNKRPFFKRRPFYKDLFINEWNEICARIKDKRNHTTK